MFQWLRWIVIASVALSSTTVSAQDNGYMYLGDAYISSGMHGAAMDSVMDSVREDAGQRGASPPARKPVDPKYVASPARTRANLARFVEKTRAADPEGAAKMAALFASTDIIGAIDARMRESYDMRVDNLADAYAVWWVGAWTGANGRSDDATRGQMAAVKAQAAAALAATPNSAAMTDAAKQELAEALLVQAALTGATVDTYKGDPAMLEKTRTAILTGARRMGLMLDEMTLTERGFVITTGRKR